jgi:hypothetical protein
MPRDTLVYENGLSYTMNDVGRAEMAAAGWNL